MSELLRALGALAEVPGPASSRLAAALDLPPPPDAADHADLFLFQLYPYASVYLSPEGKLGGEARDRVAGFWRALGLQPPAEPDHLTALLSLYAALAEDGSEAARHARKALLWEHLLSWLPLYIDAALGCGPSFYRSWAGLLRQALFAEAQLLGPPSALPVALGIPAPLPDPRAAGSAAFLEGLLAPARAGMVLVRDDLARGAAELGLGLRIAERRFVLEGLFSQDSARTLAWLADQARVWAGRHRRRPETLRVVSENWARRADDTAATLAALAEATRGLAFVD